MLVFREWLSGLYSLPVEFIVGLGVVNLMYGAFSFSLAVRRKRPLGLIVLLVVANGGWTVICLLAAVMLMTKASAFGVTHLVIEGLYVGWLARVEWSQREGLLVGP